VRAAATIDAFDVLAPFYDVHWGPGFVDDAEQLFDEYVAPHLKAEARILDLCCGAGHLAERLAARGYQVTGVDASAQMIGLASLKLPHVDFFRADMRSFRVERACDAVVCFYNSVNHLMSRSDVQGFLESVRLHLNPGGWLFFDFVDAAGYEQTWCGEETVTCDDRTCIVRYHYDGELQLATCLVDVGAGNEEQCFHQRPQVLATLVEELNAAGFRIATMVQAGGIEGRIGVLAQLAI
jgi:SAM-dependent methyltransferase